MKVLRICLLMILGCCAGWGQYSSPDKQKDTKREATKKLPKPEVNHFCERNYQPSPGKLYKPIKCEKLIDCDTYIGLPMWDTNDLNRCPARI